MASLKPGGKEGGKGGSPKGYCRCRQDGGICTIKTRCSCACNGRPCNYNKKHDCLCTEAACQNRAKGTGTTQPESTVPGPSPIGAGQSPIGHPPVSLQGPLSPPPFNSTGQPSHINYQESPQYPGSQAAQYGGMSAIPSPPAVLFNTGSGQLPAQAGGLYGAFQLDQSRSPFTQSSSSQQNVYLQQPSPPPPHAPNAPTPEMYQNDLSQYRITAAAAPPFGQNQQLSDNPNTVLINSSSKSPEASTICELNKKLEYAYTVIEKMNQKQRQLIDIIHELRGNIRVFCRVRPPTPKETEQMKALCKIRFIDDCTIEVDKSAGSDAMSCSGKLQRSCRGTKETFSFDKVFTRSASQAEVFKELAFSIQSAVEGYNVCVFAYGQTGSGKTYTMEGECGLWTEGVIPRAVRHIFEEMEQLELLGWEYRIEASFLEIYNEQIVDLLDSEPNRSHKKEKKKCEIRMGGNKGQDLYVTNTQIKEIHSPEELHQCLRIAQRNRTVAAIQSNERSSRSHSVASIRLIGTNGTKQDVLNGSLNFIDLAGSEKLKTEGAVKTAEIQNINKSLASLDRVISSILTKDDYIPYRDSKLTHLLSPSLGGSSKTIMLLNVSPLDECYKETLNSLRFASNVNNCKTGSIKRNLKFL